MLSLEERIDFSLTSKNHENQKQLCLELNEYLKKSSQSLHSYCKKYNINYLTFKKRFERYGITLRKKIKSEPSLNIGICRKASTINAFKELSLSSTGKTAGVILSEYVDRCLREGRVI